MPNTTMQDLATTVLVTDPSTVTTDQSAITAAAAVLATDNATELADTTTQTADVASLVAALAASGPFYVPNPDGSQSIILFALAAATPGYTTTVVPSGASVPVPAAPTPAPAPPTS